MQINVKKTTVMKISKNKGVLKIVIDAWISGGECE